MKGEKKGKLKLYKSLNIFLFKGEKHQKSLENYIPKELKIGSLEYLINKHDSWVLGLSYVEEYSPSPSEKMKDEKEASNVSAYRVIHIAW